MTAVFKRFTEVRATQLVNSVAMSAFISLFPLILVSIAVLGFVAARNNDLGDKIIDNLHLTDGLKTTFSENFNAAKMSRQATSLIGLGSLCGPGSTSSDRSKQPSTPSGRCRAGA